MDTPYASLAVNPELAQSLDAVAREEVCGEDARQALGRLLQAALRLEFAVIPVYLSAAFSLGGANEAIGQLILRVAIEEMLHFTVVANTLNAIGIAPDLKAAVPTYPCDVDVVEPPLHLELKSFSLELITETFLRIETPDTPIIFEFVAAKTVGEFYRGIIEIIESDTIPGLFDVDPANRNAAVIPDPPAFPSVHYRDDDEEGDYPLPESIDFRITDRDSAVRHLKWLVDQGEGTSRDDTDPIDLSGLPAHYYRFVSILKGRYLIADAGATNGFAYRGGQLPFDPGDVHDCDPNPRVADYANKVRLLAAMNQFNTLYSQMVDGLIVAFGSRDEGAARAAYVTSVGGMRRMLNGAQKIYRAATLDGVKGGVPFEYQQV